MLARKEPGMGTFGDGPWKEGRKGGASLLYAGLTPEQLTQVQANHAAVHIRATLACGHVIDGLSVLVERNWDLAIEGASASTALAGALETLDHRPKRGVILPDRPEPAVWELYRVVEAPESISAPAPSLERALASRALPTDLDEAKQAIDQVVGAGAWAIWRVDAATFDRMPTDSHKRLLQWLGDHHGRIWCAPVRDIATWRP
jgi:hypothetical protein